MSTVGGTFELSPLEMDDYVRKLILIEDVPHAIIVNDASDEVIAIEIPGGERRTLLTVPDNPQDIEVAYDAAAGELHVVSSIIDSSDEPSQTIRMDRLCVGE